MAYFFFISMILFLIICVLLIMIVLIQKGRGGGLSGAFGGGGGNTAFGTKTGDVLTWATSIIFGIFLVLAVVLNLMADHVGQAAPPPQTHNIAPQQGSSGTTGNPTGAGQGVTIQHQQTPVSVSPSTQQSK